MAFTSHFSLRGVEFRMSFDDDGGDDMLGCLGDELGADQPVSSGSYVAAGVTRRYEKKDARPAHGFCGLDNQ